MSRQSYATLPLTTRKPSARGKSVVLRVTIFTRPESKFFQASISIAGKRKRLTTRTVMRQSAMEFAELAYRHFARTDRQSDSDREKHGLTAPPQQLSTIQP